MTNDPASAGAGRDGKLREKVEEWRAKANSGRIQGDIATALLVCMDDFDAILAVPDPLASDTGQGKAGEQVQILAKRVTCNEHSMGVLCKLCRKEGNGCLRLWAVDGEWPLASSSAPQGEKATKI